MINEIEKMEMPEWLKNGDFRFNVKTILKDSLYYPSSGLDGDPVKYFMGNVYSFMYVDYGISREEFLYELQKRGFCGYHIIHQQSLTPRDLTPNGWIVRILPDGYKDVLPWSYIKKPFCEWVVFERNANLDDTHNPKRFSLIQLCGEGVATYQAVYLSNNIKPKIIAIIQPGHSFGMNWTDFTNRKEIFAKSVFYNEDLLPDYLINGEWEKRLLDRVIWDEYNVSVKEFFTGRSTLHIWKRMP